MTDTNTNLDLDLSTWTEAFETVLPSGVAFAGFCAGNTVIWPGHGATGTVIDEMNALISLLSRTRDIDRCAKLYNHSIPRSEDALLRRWALPGFSSAGDLTLSWHNQDFSPVTQDTAGAIPVSIFEAWALLLHP